jgi:type I restriction enzyme, S subunit
MSSIKLKNIATLKYGGALASDVRDDTGDYMVYGSNGPVGLHNKPNTKGRTIIVGRKGSYGKVLYSKNPVFVIDTAYSIDETSTDADLKWLYYVLQTLDFEGSSLDTGVPGLSREFAHNSLIPQVPKDRQQNIAEYIDEKVAIIDKIVAAKNHTHARLFELRKSILEQLFRDARINNPDLWKVSHAFKLIGSGTTPKSSSPEYHEEGTINWLITGDLNDSEITETSKKITAKALFDYSTLKTYPSDSLVIAMYGATIAKLGLLKVPTTVNQACCVLVPGKNIIPRYAYYYFLSSKQKLIDLGSGGGQPNISQVTIRSFKIILPALEEQQKIVKELDEKLNRINNASKLLLRSIDILEEYRIVLISNAITGKVYV